VLRPLADPEPACRLGRLTVAHGPDGYAWAVLARRDGAEVRRWAGDVAVAALLRLLPTAAPAAGAGETATLVVVGTVVAVAVLVSVVLDEPGAGAPFLFLPDDSRRLGVEPRPGERWALELAVDLDGPTIRAPRLVGVTAP
jgi:hypothetical protein